MGSKRLMSINNHEHSMYTLSLLPESDCSDTNTTKRSHCKTKVWSILTRCWELFCKYFITACWHTRPHGYKLFGGMESDSGAKSMSTRDQEMKKRLQHHFRGHIQKWMDKDHPRFPWKAALHILLVGVVTAQVRYSTHRLAS